MINVINTNALKSIPLSQFTAADFGYASDVQRLPVDRAYREVGWYRRALDLRANGVSGMPFDLLKGDTVVFTEQSNLGDVPDVLNIFNLLGQMVLDLDKYGACYAVFETDIFGYKKEWRRLHPSSIQPEFNGSTGELTHFTRWYGAKDNKHRFELDELLWLWMPPDNSENRPGSGVGYTGLLTATGMANKSKFEAYYFERGAIDPTLVKIKGFANQPPDEQKRVRNVLQNLMGGIRNAFKITPIDGDLEVFKLMSSLKDMALDKMTTQQREDIATTLGVPQTILFSNAANYATAAQDDFHFYDKTIAPFCRMVIAPQLNERLFERAGMQLRFVKNRLEVYQEMESKKAYALVPLFDRRIVSANQVLQYLDMEEFAEDWYKDTSVASEVSVSGQGNQVTFEDEADYTPEQKLLPHPLTPSPLASARSSHDYREGEQKDSENNSYPVLEDIEKWERMAIKRWDEGKRDKAIQFESALIPAGLRGAIKGGLESAQTVDDVKLVFADAMKYVAHSH